MDSQLVNTYLPVIIPASPAWSELDTKGGIGAEAFESLELPVQGRYGASVVRQGMCELGLFLGRRLTVDSVGGSLTPRVEAREGMCYPARAVLQEFEQLRLGFARGTVSVTTGFSPVLC